MTVHMNKMIRWSGALLLAIFLTACQSGGGSNMTPEEVGQAFLDEMAEADFNGAKQYATKDSEQLLSSFAQMAALGGDQNSEIGEKVEVTGAEVDGDVATVMFVDPEKGNDAGELRVVKEDGAWKVAFSKNSLMNQALEEEMEEEEESPLNSDEFKEAMKELDAALDTLKDLTE